MERLFGDVAEYVKTVTTPAEAVLHRDPDAREVISNGVRAVASQLFAKVRNPDGD